MWGALGCGAYGGVQMNLFNISKELKKSLKKYKGDFLQKKEYEKSDLGAHSKEAK